MDTESSKNTYFKHHYYKKSFKINAFDLIPPNPLENKGFLDNVCAENSLISLYLCPVWSH